MLLGIDVGGTYTDAALFENGEILKTYKSPTDTDHLSTSLKHIINTLLSFPESQGKPVDRIVLSTTLVTNLLATKKTKPTALILMPGHSLPPSSYELSKNRYFLSGMIDFRGKIVEEINLEEINDCIGWIKKNSFTEIAIAGKFSNRNPEHEEKVALLLKEHLPKVTIVLSHRISGKLNFPRRAVTALYTAKVINAWQHFSNEIVEAVKSLGIQTDIQILKADGGTLPLSSIGDNPCETIFSGPAASAMGALALHRNTENAVIVDVGGTTSDIALIISGIPLMASRGAMLNNHFTQIEALAVDSIPLGGDSLIEINKTTGLPFLQSFRIGPAICFGGEKITLTDVINTKNNLCLGNYTASFSAISTLAKECNMSVLMFCAEIEKQAIEKLVKRIKHMYTEWENEPAYKIWEVVHRTSFKPDKIIGIGAGASLILPATANVMKLSYEESSMASVANAIGAALVKPTLRVLLHADTITGKMSLTPANKNEITFLKDRHIPLSKMKEKALYHLQKCCKQANLPFSESECEFFMEEQFNVISGWGETNGSIFDIGVQIRPGFIAEIKEA